MNLTPLSEFTISINMTSDWHIGSGSSRGELDRAVQRDSDNLPYIPAKTLNGILRDGCEQVALALDNDNKKGKWHNWVNFLFGSQPTLIEQTEIKTPYPAVVKIHSAFLTDSLRNSLKHKDKPQLKSAIAFMKPGVAIDPETGSAKSNNLRFEEVVRMGAILRSKNCMLDFSGYPKITDDQKKVAFALLIAGTKLIDRIGGKRRRGNGKCEITISDLQRDNWLEWLRENYTKISDPPKWEQPEPENNDYNPKADADATWLTIPLTITTLSPVVIPKRTVGNVVECLDYIPGRYFLGHLHQQLGKVINVKSAIAQSHLIITNATIVINDSPSHPTPLCLFGEKLNGGLSNGKGVYNRFQEVEPNGIQLKGERGGYISQFDGSTLPQYQTVKLQVNTHNTIDDKYQRPSPETGGAVYSYQAIPSNTTFKAELRFPKSIKNYLDQQSPNWIEALNANLRIGQSKKDQYGLVCFKMGQPYEWELSKSIEDNQPLYIWLLSDVLLRDQRLNPTTNPEDFKRELEKQLDLEPESLEEREDDELLSMMARSRRTESWQVRWRLPRPSMLGLQAGSCFVYQIAGNKRPAPEKLAELEAKGIGERRVEGYGQICFNDPLLTAELKDKTQLDSEGQPPDPQFTRIAFGDSSFNYARTIETAAWRHAIEKKALAIAASREKRQEVLGIKIDGEESHPSMSQLGGLRSTLRRLRSLRDQGQITSWIEAIKKVPNRREKWDKTDNGLHKIRELVTNDQKIWQALNIASLDELTITVGGCNELKQILWAEAVRTLVDAMIRAHKRDLEKAQGQKVE